MGYDVEEIRRCFKCGSERVVERFRREDTPDEIRYFDVLTQKYVSFDNEDYQVHYDCLICLDCRAWDFPDYMQWHSMYITGGFTCDCGCEKLKVVYNDILQDWFEVKCTKCQKVHELKKLPAKKSDEDFDNWNEL